MKLNSKNIISVLLVLIIIVLVLILNRKYKESFYQSGGSGSCSGKCGGESDGCFCDESCVNLGDCCDDYNNYCALGGAGALGIYENDNGINLPNFFSKPYLDTPEMIKGGMILTTADDESESKYIIPEICKKEIGSITWLNECCKSCNEYKQKGKGCPGVLKLLLRNYNNLSQTRNPEHILCNIE